MGTSKANIGPKGRPNPVPEWEGGSNQNISSDSNSPQPNSDNPEMSGNESVDDNQLNWSDVRRSFTAFIKNSSKSNYKRFTANYRKASGGKKGLAKSAIGGKRGAFTLINFISSINEIGFDETLKKYNIGDISELKAEGAINKIAELFGEIDGTDEGSAATSAAIETINKLYNEYIDNPESINELENYQISDYLEFYISQYIFERISIEITNALEVRSLSAKEVKDIEDQIELYIEAEVKLNFSNSNFSELNMKDQSITINKIFEDAYSLI